jgi:hypothetical protein
VLPKRNYKKMQTWDLSKQIKISFKTSSAFSVYVTVAPHSVKDNTCLSVSSVEDASSSTVASSITQETAHLDK